MARKRSKNVDPVAQIDELVMSTWGMDNGPTKVAILEQAVRLADAHNEDEHGFGARLDLIDAATFGGSPDVALVAFAWCLAKVDAEPQRFDVGPLLWKYKWTVDAAVEYPTIAKQQLADMLDDMERRYRAAGSGLHPVHQTAREAYRVMGDLPAAKAAHSRVVKSRRSFLSNCEACEQHAQVKFYLDLGQRGRAYKKAEPLLAGRLSCMEVPHCTYSHLLLPKLFDGEAELAAEYHRQGTRLLGHNPKFVTEAARHLIYLTVADELPAAVKYLQKHLPNAVACTCPAWKFEFARAATFCFDRLAERPRPLKVRLPANLGLPKGVDGTNLTALRDHFAAEARVIGKAFDARNGNDRYARRLAELADLKEKARAVAR